MIDANVIGMILLGILSWALLIVAIIAAFMWRSQKNRQYKTMLDAHIAAKKNRHHTNA